MRCTWILAGGLMAFPHLAWGWQHVVGGTPDPGRVNALALTAEGDVIAGGRYGAGVAADDGLVVRLAATDGAEQWRCVLAGTAAADDIVREVALLSGGDVVALGAAVDATTGSDGLVARLGKDDGVPVWRRDLDGGSAANDNVRAGLVVGDDVVAVGATTRPDQAGPFVVWRLAGQDGTTVWETPVDGPSSVARVVAADGGALYVAGHVANAPTGTQIIVVKLDAASGMVQWNVTLGGTGAPNDVVQAIAVVASQVIVAADLHTDPTAPDAVVVALDTSTGAEAWRRAFDGTAPGTDTDRGWALAVRAPDAVVVAATLQDATTGEDVVVARLEAATGAEVWRTALDGPTRDDDEARDVVVNAAGDVVVAGRSRAANFDGLVAKLAGTTGQEVWRSAVRGSGGDAILALVPGPGVVGAGGFTSNGPGADEFTVAFLADATGGSLPCGNGVDDPGEACDDGNLTAGDGCRRDCTVERCGDGIRDPQEACDPPLGTSSPCCADDCTSEPDGTPCDDGDVCTGGDACDGGACAPSPGPPCDDVDPCTVDVCTLDGCAHSLIGGIPAATCVLARPRVGAACAVGLPRGIERALTRMTDRLAAAAAAASDKKRMRALKATRATARKARAQAKRLGRRDPSRTSCTGVVIAEMDDLIGRVTTLLSQ